MKRRGDRKRTLSWKLRTPWKDTREGIKKQKVMPYNPLVEIPEKLDRRFQKWLDDTEVDNAPRKTAYAFRDKVWFQNLLKPCYWMSDEVKSEVLNLVSLRSEVLNLVSLL